MILISLQLPFFCCPYWFIFKILSSVYNILNGGDVLLGLEGCIYKKNCCGFVSVYLYLEGGRGRLPKQGGGKSCPLSLQGSFPFVSPRPVVCPRLSPHACPPELWRGHLSRAGQGRTLSCSSLGPGAAVTKQET